MGVLVSARAGQGALESAAGASPWNELLCPATFSSCVQLIRCRGPRERVMGFLQGSDLSDGWGKQGSRGLLGIGKSVAEMTNMEI